MSAENFKSLRNFELDFGSSITLLIGANATGKSNIVDVLSFVRDWIIGGLTQALSKRGDYRKVVSFGNVDEPILIKLAFRDVESGQGVNYQLRVTFRPVIEEVIEGPQSSISIQYEDGTATARLNGTKSVRLRELHGLPQELSQALGQDFTAEVSIMGSIRETFERCYRASAFRSYRPSHSIRGRIYPDEGGTDLALHVHQLLTGGRSKFRQYERRLMRIVPKIKEINSPILEGSDETTVSVIFEDLDGAFSLEQLSSGTQELLFMVLNILGSPPYSIVLLEEPENHLHAEAQMALVELIKEVTEDENKQLIVTSHADVILDQLIDSSDVFFISMDNHRTGARHLDELEDINVIWDNLGIERSKLGYILGRRGNVIVIMEGRTEIKAFEPLWDNNDLRDRVLPVRPDGGNWQEIVEHAAALKRALEKFKFSSNVFILLDSDSDHEEKVDLLRRKGFRDGEFFVWPDKEIEEYLLLPRALADISSKTEEEVEMVLQRAKGRGKQKLDWVTKELGIDDLGPKTLIKKAIALHEVPKEFENIIAKIKQLIS